VIVISLQSGSNGNCTYVESGDTAILIDAGIPGSDAANRLEAAGRDIRAVKAVVISHDHADHCRAAGVYSRMFGIPLHITKPTMEAAGRRFQLGHVERLEHFAAGETIRIGALRVETVPTPHDGADGVAFVVQDRRRRVGVLTDLGHVFPGLPDVVRSLHGVLIESNYDPDLLSNGPYPEWLKARIRGPGGHLSNSEAAELIRVAASPCLEWVCLAHLSEENNTSELALERSRRELREVFPLLAASRFGELVLPEL